MANDLWRTPPEIIGYVTQRFGLIEIDLCSSDENKVCKFNITEEDDFLRDEWLKSSMINLGGLAWCNPPYSKPLPFVEQCVKWAKYGYAVAGILNFDPSTKWFCELLDANDLIIPISGGRVAFLNDEGKAVKGNSKPQFIFYLAPFLSQTQETEFININEIYGDE